ncbi:ATP-binding cassette domain-containing protein [Benzoatithermus flavus]|uniref:ATP-binding cassette domain-containing protein n=1 Tax=Benzoatithermus flavus TaxID=3108223 RepID=A0ABU8XRS9_9PROT
MLRVETPFALTAPAAAVRARPILPLEARGLVLETAGRRLVDGLDLELQPGALTVILGPNGAGKSLALRLLHGLLRPTAGAITWAGRAADADVRRRQAMVFQKPVLLRRSTAANLDYVLKRQSLSRSRRRARLQELLTLGNLLHLARVPARLLSGGEQQRLAVVRALACEPEVLFLDEPTASLDPAATLAIEALIERAHGAGTAILLVTHDLGQARRLAREVVFLHQGRAVEKAEAAAFFAGPRSAIARAYLAGDLAL